MRKSDEISHFLASLPAVGRPSGDKILP